MKKKRERHREASHFGIAWDITGEDTSVAKLLGKFGVDAVDVAPGKLLLTPTNAKD